MVVVISTNGCRGEKDFGYEVGGIVIDSKDSKIVRSSVA